MHAVDKDKLIQHIKAILSGIDECETDSDDGWWETSKGSEFGFNKLEDVIIAIESA